MLTNKGKHRFTRSRLAGAGLAAVGAAALALGLLSIIGDVTPHDGGVANAAVMASPSVNPGGGIINAPTYTKNGDYQFAASSASVSAHNEFSNSPLSYSDASQTLGPNGVNLSVAGTADAGVVVPLGRLHSLFNADGQFVPPVIVGSNLEGYNLYFDTSASDTYLGYPGGSAVFLDQGQSDTPPYDGTNKCAMGVINGTSPSVECDSVWAGQPTGAIPDAPANEPYTMQQIRTFFKNNTNGNTNPLVWAWIGAGDGATNNSVPSYVTSVNGTKLVNTVIPAGSCVEAGSSYNSVTAASVPFYLGVPNKINTNGTSVAELKPTKSTTTNIGRCTANGKTELYVMQDGVPYALTTRATAAGATVTLQPAHAYSSQLWTVSGTTAQQFKNAKTGLYLRVRNGGPVMYDTVTTGSQATAWNQG